MIRIFSISIFLITSFSGIGKDIKYPVSEIPDSLKENSIAVVREEKITNQILSRDHSIYHVYRAVTILKEKAKKFSSIVVFYDKFRKINLLKGWVYDASGNLIKELKGSDIYDQSAIADYTLYADNRLKFASLSGPTYPFTVVVEYEIEFKFLYSLPTFTLYDDDEVAIQHSTFEITHPKDLDIRFKNINTGDPSVKSMSNGDELIRWSFNYIKPSKFEPYSPQTYEFIPTIMVGPSEFSYSGYSGKMDSWKSYGEWIALLNKNRDVLPASTISKVKEITNGLSDLEKIRVLYAFLQNKTRYVSIQLGIGGLQPMEAKEVDEAGYGDCKALSNYMVSLLKAAGITAYYTLIGSGKNADDVQKDFVNDYFDHIIVTVPMQKDTIWLECTSQTNPLGYLGSFTSDRYGLMISTEGGILVKTHSYEANENVQSRTGEVVIDEKGNAQAHLNTVFRGLQFENGGLSELEKNDIKGQKDWVIKSLSIPNFNLVNFDISKTEATATVSSNLTLNQYASVSGKRMFLAPNLTNRFSSIPDAAEKRSLDVIRRYGFTDYDTIVFVLPENLYPEFLPESVEVNSPFGSFVTTYKMEQGKLTFIRKLTFFKGRFPPESFNELREFYTKIVKADNTKVVFLTKT